ncbi:hypothetical protein BN1048_01733 [Jeotgalicoccus saudimassiliensis]|uniref:Uncharacterized protein n=1 Tax=Jeotgalicoccus saudimassiliensis TaxID=1461582 RepID=A0A078M877_9STAP|nr:hypothetical protein [Jeotgalicoccus saudimassiliensis]CEA02489.1 hypothetical protein BN1048_01733 [Jeotgalicoccus saudimassiliensis]
MKEAANTEMTPLKHAEEPLFDYWKECINKIDKYRGVYVYGTI